MPLAMSVGTHVTVTASVTPGPVRAWTTPADVENISMDRTVRQVCDFTFLLILYVGVISENQTKQQQQTRVQSNLYLWPRLLSWRLSLRVKVL